MELVCLRPKVGSVQIELRACQVVAVLSQLRPPFIYGAQPLLANPLQTYRAKVFRCGFASSPQVLLCGRALHTPHLPPNR